MGLSFEALHERYPRLIVCDISGYGEGGPYERKKAYDLLIQSEGGFLSTTGGPGEEQMAKAGCSIADIAAGMYAYSGVLAALLLRERTGEGSRIDVSMLEGLVEWMGYPMYYAFEGAQQPPRAGTFRPKLRYAHQGGSNPPRIVVHGTALNHISDGYRRYLERFFRETFKLQGTPLKIEFRQGANPYAKHRGRR